MNRPVTPEKTSQIYRDNTICQLTRSVDVRIKDSLPQRVYCFATGKDHELPAGCYVTVFDGQAANLTGEDHPLSTDGIGYRIESELEFTVYESVGKVLTNYVDPKLRKHSNFQLIASSREMKPGSEFPIGSVVALKEGGTYKGVGPVPRGALFAIVSEARTPLGQNLRMKDLIEKGVYSIVRVEKGSRLLKVRNSSNTLVMHKHLQRKS
ncbi:hypothetical protein C0995_011468 [Termitomyces sp. Mi166|nr:hypothetical protein C0995_011468 [Termitomyces sp. Mi166\